MNALLEAAGKDPLRNFRFFDNRQKYLLFVNTCSEKWVVANRVTMELANIHPHPPAVRVFDAGIGDGTVLSRVMRAMHHRFPTMPFYIAGKEISLEDVRLALQRMADRFFEHPATALVQRYAARWSIEQAFADARNVLGGGEARTRARRAVERTVPFTLLVHTLVVELAYLTVSA